MNDQHNFKMPSLSENESLGLLPSGFELKDTTTVSVNEITHELARNTLSDITNTTPKSPVQSTATYIESAIPTGPPKLDRASQIVKEYLLGISSEFVRVTQLRDRGWHENKAEGDAYFKRQRERADNADEEGRKRFHDMMLTIADEMERVTGGLRVKPNPVRDIRVLDICMAPGGYTIAALKYNPNAKVHAITLPEDQGGHPIIIDKKKLDGLQLLDVTHLVKEFCDGPVPENHPDKAHFIPIRPFKFYRFALVFCDGMVLRTQDRPSYRQETEITRLACAQLILAMQRVIYGGTIIMLLHKVDSWHSAHILYLFNKFSTVHVFKPSRAHSSRSSFYMVAKDIQTEHEAAKDAIAEWKRVWYKATFGGPEGLGIKDEPEEGYVRQVLAEFGEQLGQFGFWAWRIQADALSKTTYAGDKYESRFSDRTPTREGSDERRDQGRQVPEWKNKRRESESSTGGDGGFKARRESESSTNGGGFKNRRPSMASSSGAGGGSGRKERRESLALLENWRLGAGQASPSSAGGGMAKFPVFVEEDTGFEK